jgi:glycosyltransferase involved in cell wall biosynthesis
MSPRVLRWVPLPPPFAGPEVASAALAEACREHLPGVRIENASIRKSNMEKGRFDLSGAASFATAFLRYVKGTAKSDVVCLVASSSTVGCIRDAALIGVARALRRRVVLHLRGGRYADFFAESTRPMQRLLRWSWGSAERAIVQTPGLHDLLEEAAPHVEVSVLPNGLVGEHYEEKADYRGTRRILFLGHLTYHKGFYDLMQAWPSIKQRWPDAVLVCAGELPTPLRSWAAFLPDAHKQAFLLRRHEICDETRAFVKREDVEYHGVVSGDEKAELFTSADLLVLPSYAEGFSLAVLEAMFHGLPIVTTNAGGLPDVVRAEQNGLVISPGDQDALVAALTRLLGDDELRERIGRRNAQEARERYELRDVALQFSNILASSDRLPTR